MSHRSAYPRKLLLASTSALSFLITAPVAAQSAESGGDVQEVVVTGFRASLQSALDAKRNSDLPIESVAPEDIGKMPDQNVAEALQRLPGVQIDRTNGQGTSVLIDGLRQNLTTLNGNVFLTGKEFYTSGEASGGGAGANAQYGSLEGVPSEEIGGIDVYKNPKASITEGGLGGTIDLKTRDALAGPDGWTLGGNFRMTNGQRDTDWTPNGTLVASYKANSRLAVTGSFSYDAENTHTQEYEAYNRSPWLITNSSSTMPASGPLTGATIHPLPNGQSYIFPEFGYFTDLYDERKTIGASFGVAYQVTDSIKTKLDWFYSREDDVVTSYSNKAVFDGSQAKNTAAAPAVPGTFTGTPGTSSFQVVTPYSAATPATPAVIPGVNPSLPYGIDGNNVLTNGTILATGAETATLYQHNISDANNLQWDTAFNNGGPLRADLNVSYAYATDNFQAAQQDIEHGLYNSFSGAPTSPGAPGCNNISATCTTGNAPYQFTYSNGGTSGLPSVNYLSNVLSNPAYATFKSAWAWANLSSQQDAAIKLDAEYDPAFIKTVDSVLSAGVRIANRDVDQTFGRYLINGASGNGTPLPNCCQDPHGGPWLYYQDPGYASIPYSTALSNPGLAKTVNNFASGSIIVKNPSTGGMTNPATFLNTVWSGAGVPNNSETFFVDSLSSFNVHETTNAGYLMGDIGGAKDRFHVNFGLRVVQTNLTINNAQTAPSPTYYGSAVWNGVNSNNIPVTTNRSYTDLLPSMNFVLDVSDDEKIRLGAARVMSPQDLFLLGIGNSYNFTRQTNQRINIHTGAADGFAFAGGTSGNAQLDPYRANQGNLSYENYFSRSGLVSIGGFWKQIDNFNVIENIPTTVVDDFGGTTATVTKPINAGAGRIYGIEIGGQYSFDGKWYPWLDGFGVAANYTLSVSTDSLPDLSSANGGFVKTTIPGVSKNSVTATAYYERAGYSVRASYSWRDKAINDGVGGANWVFADVNGIQHQYNMYTAPYGQLDGQIGYDVNEHFGLIFSVQNLTDAAQHVYMQYPNQPFTYDDSGRRFFLGGKFKL